MCIFHFHDKPTLSIWGKMLGLCSPRQVVFRVLLPVKTWEKVTPSASTQHQFPWLWGRGHTVGWDVKAVSYREITPCGPTASVIS